MKKCRSKGCDNEFVQYSTLQNLCVPCSIAKGRKIEAKEERKEHQKRKDNLLTLSDHMKLTQAVFNKWIRLRDARESCISCGTQNPNVQYCAGHYFTRGGHPELRFDELNVHKQCNKHCNLELSGNIAAYRVNLIRKIGQDAMDYLEGPHDPKNYTIDDLKQIRKYYAKLSRELEKACG